MAIGSQLTDIVAKSASHWEINRIVAELRNSRSRSHRERDRGRAVFEMPSRGPFGCCQRSVRGAVSNSLRSARLDQRGHRLFVGHRLDATLWSLLEQVKRELKLPRARLEPDGLPEVIGGRAR